MTFASVSLALILIIFGSNRLLNPSMEIEWTTESEVDTLGFNLLRVCHSNPGEEQQINHQLILGLGSPISGETYKYVDRSVKVGQSYTYQLQEITLSNEIVALESINIKVKYQGLIEIVVALVLLVLSFVLARIKKPLR